jgi:biotin carboxyl carrier protein
MAKVKLNLQGEEQEFEISRQQDMLHLTNGSFTAECRIMQQDGNAFVLEWRQPDGRRQHIHVAGVANGDQRQVWVDGRTFTYARVTPRGGANDPIGALSATIPAVVTTLLVSEGTAVVAGDKLILLESMKMVIPIQAPYDGIVTAVHCAPGDSVQAGVPLIEIDKVTET